MKRLILHVGHSKCASSSVQSFLSLYPDHALAGGKGMLRHVVVTGDGRVLHSEKLASLAARLPQRYANSAAHFLSDPDLFERGWKEIEDFAGPDDTIITSSESWCGPNFLTPEVEANLNSLPIRPDVFYLTRPPVDWANAAWWQWGVWAQDKWAENLEDYCAINFLETVRLWEAVENIGTVGVFDISQGPLECLARFANLELDGPIEFGRVNVATDYDLLRHLVRNPSNYRRTESFPLDEFRLNNFVKADRKPLPFVVLRQMARDMLAAQLQDNRALIARIAANGRPLATGVARKYVDPSAYDHLSDDDPLADFRADYTDAFVGTLVETILEMGSATERQLAFEEALRTFDPAGYLALNPDVAAAGVNPFEHFMRFGYMEGRLWYV